MGFYGNCQNVKFNLEERRGGGEIKGTSVIQISLQHK